MLLPSALPCDNSSNSSFILPSSFSSSSSYHPISAAQNPSLLSPSPLLPKSFPLLALPPALAPPSIHQSPAQRHHDPHQYQLHNRPLQTTSLLLQSLFATPITPPRSTSNKNTTFTNHDNNSSSSSSNGSNQANSNFYNNNIIAPRPHRIPRIRPSLYKAKFNNHHLPTPPRTPTPTLVPAPIPTLIPTPKPTSTSTKPPLQSGSRSKKRHRSSSPSSPSTSQLQPQPQLSFAPTAPSTPKRRRLVPPSLPLGLDSADFAALECANANANAGVRGDCLVHDSSASVSPGYLYTYHPSSASTFDPSSFPSCENLAAITTTSAPLRRAASPKAARAGEVIAREDIQLQSQPQLQTQFFPQLRGQTPLPQRRVLIKREQEREPGIHHHHQQNRDQQQQQQQHTPTPFPPSPSSRPEPEPPTSKFSSPSTSSSLSSPSSSSTPPTKTSQSPAPPTTPPTITTPSSSSSSVVSPSPAPVPAPHTPHTPHITTLFHGLRLHEREREGDGERERGDLGSSSAFHTPPSKSYFDK